MATYNASFADDSGETRLDGTLTLPDLATDTWAVATVTTTGAVNIGGALNHDGTTVGFYGTAPIAKQTGVAVSAAGVHAALVALGLIAA